MSVEHVEPVDHLPRRGELIPVSKNASKPDIKPMIQAALDDDVVMDKVEPFLTNGGVEGHKLLDLNEVRQIVLAFDDNRGGMIRRSKMTSKEQIDQIAVTLRRTYQLDKHGKVTGVNQKRYALLEHSTATAAAEGNTEQ